MANNQVSKSWFAVLANPEDHGYSGTPQKICEAMRDEWLGSSTTRSGAWAYCVSADGLRHVHAVLEDTVAMRFSVIKKTYAAGMHFEATKGSKQQAEDYINKRTPYDEKGEKVLCIIKAGEIKGNQGKRSDLDEITALLNEGKTPDQIMDGNLHFRRFDRLIRDEYFARRRRQTPPIRDVKVHWICGASGCGKSYRFVQLCEEVGEENVYFIAELNNGSFDKYIGEKILFIDDLKESSLSYASLLLLLDCYKRQVSARYSNVFALWSEVYVTSVYAPEQFYRALVPVYRRDVDTYEQLRRRITDFSYCYRATRGQRKQETVLMDFYNGITEFRKSIDDEVGG